MTDWIELKPHQFKMLSDAILELYSPPALQNFMLFRHGKTVYPDVGDYANWNPIAEEA